MECANQLPDCEKHFIGEGYSPGWLSLAVDSNVFLLMLASD